MRTRTTLPFLAVAGGLTFALAPGAGAAKPVKPPKAVSAVSLNAAPALLTFTQTTALTGRVTGPTTAGIAVRLEADSIPPLGDRFTSTGKTATTVANGGFNFAVAPGVNTLYRVVAKTAPDVTSVAQRVRVRPLVGLTLSDSTPRRGALVTFSGSIRPVHNGLLVSIQRRTATGRWATVTRTALKAAATPDRSTFSRKLRVRADGVYRIVLPAHNDNVTGISRVRSVKVH